jgi:periplasmic mercuric ion binding protein
MKKLIITSATAIALLFIFQLTAKSITSNNLQVESFIHEGTETLTLKVTGMTCAGCANNLSMTIDGMDGVVDQEVKFPGDIATIKYDPEKISEKEIISSIEESGKYKVTLVTEDKKSKK